MLKIYGADLSSPSNKVRFAANALGLDYEYIQVRLRDGEHRKEDFLKLNPAGKIPVIDDDGFILFESGAICRYLADKNDSDLYPKELTRRAIVDQWNDFVAIHVQGAMGRVVFNRLFASLARVEVDERSLQDGLKFLDRFFPVVEGRLQTNAYLAGEAMSLADITLLATLDPVELAEIDISRYPKMVNLRNALKEKEFYTKCYKEYGEPLRRMRANR